MFRNAAVRASHFVLDLMREFGCDPRRFMAAALGLPAFIADFVRFRRNGTGQRGAVRIRPCLTDRRHSSGVASGHYFHQDLLVARRVFETSPRRHLDIGSRIDGFVAHVAVFRPIEVVDVRELHADVTNILFQQADITRGAPADWIAQFDSISCLHALEHFGLGRYGDCIDVDGHRKGLSTIASLLAPGGRLYLSVPMGSTRVEFNAHRIFHVRELIDWVEEQFEVERLSYVDDRGRLHEGASIQEGKANNFGCEYGCAILELRKV